MTRFTPLRALSLLLGMGLAVAAGTAGMAKSDTASLRCDITQSTSNGMRTIDAIVHSPSATSGQYSFAIQSVSNGNSATISQGGVFSVAAETPTPIGQMQINAGARYSVDFSIMIDGQSIECTTKNARST